MKDKIFQSLKQAYSSLGLGDALLQAQAETLASLGFVTDENLDAVVKAQETQLKAYQAANDKRVADALTKVKEAADKDKKTAETAAAAKQGELQKLIDELTEKSNRQTSELQKQADELKKQQELQKQLDDLQKKAEQQTADFEKRKAVPSDLDGINKQMAEILKTNKSLAEQVQALVKENANFKAAQAAESRKNFILSKAEELGIPKWRINEGFSLAPDASEETITNTLTTVASNIRANMLPQDGISLPDLGGGNSEAFKGQIDQIAETLVQSI